MGSGASVLLKAQVYFTDILMVSISVATKIFENFDAFWTTLPSGKDSSIETKWLMYVNALDLWSLSKLALT